MPNITTNHAITYTNWEVLLSRKKKKIKKIERSIIKDTSIWDPLDNVQMELRHVHQFVSVKDKKGQKT